ncbi:MAG: type II secretion system F family protein [Clostridia bacterium]|nr:type II secretion system F family protein [Clostridia bacterium]
MKKRKLHWNELFSFVFIYLLCSVFVFNAMFDSWRISILLMLCGLPIFVKKIKQYIIQKRQNRIEAEFYQLLSSISLSMSSGMSLENSLKEAVVTGKKEYKSLNAELEGIYRMMQNNYSPEVAFFTLYKKTGNREIKTFSEILSVGVPAGINLAALMRWLASAYRMRFDAECEIVRILNAPKFNNRIILAMPIVCVVLFKQIAPYYMAPLYFGTGRIIMMGVLAIILFAWWFGSKLGEIEY